MATAVPTERRGSEGGETPEKVLWPAPRELRPEWAALVAESRSQSSKRLLAHFDACASSGGLPPQNREQVKEVRSAAAAGRQLPRTRITDPAQLVRVPSPLGLRRTETRRSSVE